MARSHRNVVGLYQNSAFTICNETLSFCWYPAHNLRGCDVTEGVLTCVTHLCNFSISRRLWRCGVRVWSEAPLLFFVWRAAWGRSRWWGWRRRLPSHCGEEAKAHVWPGEVAGAELRAREQTGTGEENAACQGVRTSAPASCSLVPKQTRTLEN